MCGAHARRQLVLDPRAALQRLRGVIVTLAESGLGLLLYAKPWGTKGRHGREDKRVGFAW